jgi:Co/Zn/Cd efflux system component
MNSDGAQPPPRKVNNKLILIVSAVSFGLFVIAEIIGALAGNSLALLGDAGAMSVDECLPHEFIRRAREGEVRLN